MPSSAAAAALPDCLRLTTLTEDGPTKARLDAALRALGLPEPALWRTAEHRDGAVGHVVLVCAEAQHLLDMLTSESVGVATLVLIGPTPSPGMVPALLAAGVNDWWPVSLLDDPPSLRVTLALARARAEAGQQLQQALQRATRELDERKWVDRAKGVLMSARGLDEQQAFTLLRGAAMHANLRLGEVSRSVTETAGWAEALNRSGQLRALSQRLLKLAVQRWVGIEPKQARLDQTGAQARLVDNLRHLTEWSAQASGAAAWGVELARVRDAGQALEVTLKERLGGPMLLRADAEAEVLLDSAEALTAALEQASGRRALNVINQCGRQRMRVQRIAKQALLAHQLGDAARRDGLPALLDEFEAVLRELDETPLSNADIQLNLSNARDAWLRLLRGLHGMHTESGRLTIIQAGDALLADFERLTAAFEHSLQVLLA
ncbi:MAG: ANTAR domain-containing protein [Burkholderiales bacterium]|nr:ANTAR domain-containing protein [Burkholderiales bacterium]